MGPCIASADQIDLEDIDVGTTLNGEVMQNSNTSDLIFSVVDLIVYLSAGVTLEPGDVIATGTPGGVGQSQEPPRYLTPGDTINIEITGVGTLTNRVRAEL